MKGFLSEKGRKVILIRHTETEMNEDNLVRGWTDVPLDEDTIIFCKNIGESLKGKIDGVIASDLLRTLETAHYVSVGSGAPIIKTGNFLHTWDVGNYTGMPADKVDPILEKMAQEEPDKTIEGGESFNAFKYRFLMGLIACLNEYEGTLAFVTHGRNLATLNAWAQEDYNEDLQLSDDLDYDAYEPGSAHLFNITSSLIKKGS